MTILDHRGLFRFGLVAGLAALTSADANSESRVLDGHPECEISSTGRNSIFRAWSSGASGPARSEEEGEAVASP